MPFYAVQNNALLTAPNRVRGPRGLSLDAKRKDDYVYPVEGWYWFESEEEARKALKAWDDYVTPAKVEHSTGAVEANTGIILDENFVIRFAKTFGWDGSGTSQDFFYKVIKTLMKEKLSRAISQISQLD